MRTGHADIKILQLKTVYKKLIEAKQLNFLGTSMVALNVCNLNLIGKQSIIFDTSHLWIFRSMGQLETFLFIFSLINFRQKISLAFKTKSF